MALVTKGNEGKDPMADDEKSRREEEARRKDEQNEEEDDRDESRAVPARTAPVGIGGGFLHLYKPGQGYWTRMGTAAAAVLIIGLLARFIYRDALTTRLELSNTTSAIITSAFALGSALLAWYYFNKPTVVDFFIATESEMKKVNWTSRRDLIGSTKIVIIFMFLIAIMLFLFDLFFGYFFQLIGVLKKVL